MTSPKQAGGWGCARLSRSQPPKTNSQTAAPQKENPVTDRQKEVNAARKHARQEALVSAALKKLERWVYTSALKMPPSALKLALDDAWDRFTAFPPHHQHSLECRERKAIAEGFYYAAIDRGLVQPEE